VPVGAASLEERRHEGRVFLHQRQRVFGPEPAGARLRVMTCPHDGGASTEVACWFDPDVAAAVAYACRLEAETPARGDAAARAELATAATAPKP